LVQFRQEASNVQFGAIWFFHLYGLAD